MTFIWKEFHTVNQGYFDFGGNFDHLRLLKAILIWQLYIALWKTLLYSNGLVNKKMLYFTILQVNKPLFYLNHSVSVAFEQDAFK